MAFLITLPLTVGLARATSSILLGLLAWAAAGAIVYGLYLCNSRGAMMALAAMLLVLALRRFGWLGGMLAGPALLLPLLLLGPSRLNEISADEESAAGRVEAWYAGFDMFRAHPLFGVGKGMFVDHHELTAHNSFVLAIAEIGVVGYYFWLALLFVSAVMLFRLLQPGPPAPDEGAAVTAAAGGRPTEARTTAASTTVSTDDDSDELAPPAWVDLQRAAASLMYAFVGALVAAFFLSRTYVVLLYLLLALIVALYGIARSHWPNRVEPVWFGDWAGTIFAVELLSIGGLWLLTRVALKLQ